MHYKICHFKSLTSTQDKAKDFAEKGLSDIVVVADTQTKGRGRFRRKWYSDRGGLWMSILLKPNNIINLQYLTFAAAIAALESIKKLTNIKTSIKWPNDLHYKGKKLCGILTEGVFGKENYVMVGIGLNINQSSFPDKIKNTTTSLRTIKKNTLDIEKLTRKLNEEFFNLYKNYYNKNRFASILKIWKKNCDTINKNATITTKTKKLQGKVIGIDKDGNLLLKMKNDKIVRIMEGDVKVRYQS
ncbi:biotin--[acetyl-CoA-carboxylase] ligase [Candidatus Woesearchaeota archaeon]|nr:biotin--[acetyl-CoA-carboxylase] ligase [Candidatus Woesearchaeota archaeon]